MPYSVLFVGLHFTHILNTKLPFFGNKVLCLSVALYCSIRSASVSQDGLLVWSIRHFMAESQKKMLTSYLINMLFMALQQQQFCRGHISNKTKNQSSSKGTGSHQSHKGHPYSSSSVSLLQDQSLKLSYPDIPKDNTFEKCLGCLNAQQFCTTAPYLCLSVDEVIRCLRSFRHVLL